MNTSALKRFAQQARVILKSGVENRLLYWGFDKQGNVLEEPLWVEGGCIFREKILNDETLLSKWKALKETIRTNGIRQIAEEAAYTWFNRLMAIQILAKNDYIAPQLAFESEMQLTPQIVTNAKRGVLPELNGTQRSRLENLLNDDNLETELFALLITAYCQNNRLLQRVFGRLNDWTELLLPADILAKNSFIYLLNTTDAISGDDYREVELIGWLYQFYISEKKDEVFKNFKNKKKAEAGDIPAATQIFTPNWIVKYMVQNTVGRLWLDLNPTSPLHKEMQYLVENPDAGNIENPLITEVSGIRLLDPACGSGHILVEGFDLLFAMYLEEGYSKREAVRQILTRNLFGLDIDLRAAQLANFALLMKAVQHDRQVLDSDLLPQIYAMPEPFLFDGQSLSVFLGENKEYLPKLTEVLGLMQQSQNLGSIMKISISPAMSEQLQLQLTYWEKQCVSDAFVQEALERLKPYIRIILLLTQQYEAVAANPPYMGNGNMNDTLKEYINKHYPEGKSDLFAVFMLIALNLCLKNGRMGMINMHSWMFLSSFEVLRKKIIADYFIENMLHLGPRTFDELSGEIVQNTAFVLKKTKQIETGIYFRLVDGSNCAEKEKLFIEERNRYVNISQTNFEKIPGSPIAYWVSEKIIQCFDNPKLLSYCDARTGLSSSDNKRFLRSWNEVNYKRIFFKCKNLLESKNFVYKWYPVQRGGGYRKWFGLNYDVINWENNGEEIKNYASFLYKSYSRTIKNIPYYFLTGISWSYITSGIASFRIFDEGFIILNAGPACFNFRNCNKFIIFALLNTKVSTTFLRFLSPTLNYDSGPIANIPVPMDVIDVDIIDVDNFVNQNIAISKQDWDSRETSWDFQENELIRQQKATIEEAYQTWLADRTNQFKQLHANEVELNRLFIDIYGLQDELTPEVKLKDITILQEELDYNALGDATEFGQLPDSGTLPVEPAEVTGQFLSYSVGCLMGRYRLDKPGLHIAHPNSTAEETAPYEYNGKIFRINEDAIIPLMDATCSFPDNILARIKDFVEQIWGEKVLTANLNFIESTLGKDLESYLLKDFWKEHCRRYQKRPVYWLFSSLGGAFRVLAYMHRMNRFTVEKIRSSYLLKHIRNLENRKAVLEADTASLDKQKQRMLDKIQSDIEECRQYNLLLKDVADHQIEFDLDDGVVVNYAKFEGVVAVIK